MFNQCTYPWQGPLFMKRVLGVDGALSGAISQKRTACQHTKTNFSLFILYGFSYYFLSY